MKKLLLLLAFPAIAHGAAFDITIDQRNSANSAWLQRVPPNPISNGNGLFFIDGTTKVVKWLTVSSGLNYDSATDTLTATGTQSDWNAVSGPASILNKPTIPAAQVNSDWSASSGVAQILNKPTLAAVALSGSYSALTGAPTLATVATTGAYADLTGKPTIPAAQVNSDWNSVSGVSQILNKPSIPAAQVNADWSAGSGVAQILNKPTTLSGYGITDGVTTSTYTAGLATKFNQPAGTTAQYIRGDGSLATFPGAAVFSFGAPASRTFALATAYRCTDITKPCVLTITLQAQSSISLSGAVNNEGQIVVGATSAVASGTGTALATFKNNLGGGLVVGLNLNLTQANTYTVPMPTGYYLAILQTSGTGLQVVSSYEQVASN